MTHNRDERSGPSRRSKWYWPPYPLTFVIVGLVVGIAFIANFPAVESARPSMDGMGKYGPHFELTAEYRHGWPIRYARRESSVISDSLLGLNRSPSSTYWDQASPWKPWDRSFDFSWTAIIVDAVVWFGILLGGALLAQLWRSRRRSMWQLHVADLLGIVTLIAIVVSWHQYERAQRRDERRLFTAASGINRAPDSGDLGTAIPAWLPTRWQESYLKEFGRVEYFEGEAGVALQFPQLRVLQSNAVNLEFGELLRRMPQLEALDLFMCRFQPGDEAETFTNMRDFPPMPHLRGLNLYDSDATDADLVWLAKCPQLECLCLASTNIGDEGLQHLVRLPKLRVLTVSGGPITDEGYRSLGHITSLEELDISSSKSVTDAGVRELARLRKLQRLQLDTQASDAAIESLRRALPNCSIN